MSSERVKLSDLEREFAAGLEYVSDFGSGFTDQDRHALYGLQMQASQGDCNVEEIEEVEDIHERQRLEAWKHFGGTSSDRAKQMFISYLHKISPNFNPEVTFRSSKDSFIAMDDQSTKKRVIEKDAGGENILQKSTKPAKEKVPKKASKSKIDRQSSRKTNPLFRMVDGFRRFGSKAGVGDELKDRLKERNQANRSKNGELAKDIEARLSKRKQEKENQDEERHVRVGRIYSKDNLEKPEKQILGDGRKLSVDLDPAIGAETFDTAAQMPKQTQLQQIAKNTRESLKNPNLGFSSLNHGSLGDIGTRKGRDSKTSIENEVEMNILTPSFNVLHESSGQIEEFDLADGTHPMLKRTSKTSALDQIEIESEEEVNIEALHKPRTNVNREEDTEDLVDYILEVQVDDTESQGRSTNSEMDSMPPPPPPAFGESDRDEDSSLPPPPPMFGEYEMHDDTLPRKKGKLRKGSYKQIKKLSEDIGVNMMNIQSKKATPSPKQDSVPLHLLKAGNARGVEVENGEEELLAAAKVIAEEEAIKEKIQRERADILDRVERFYQKHSQEMLAKGLGTIVDYVMEKGIEKLNQKLLKKYGEILPDSLPANNDESVRKETHESVDKFFSEGYLKRELEKSPGLKKKPLKNAKAKEIEKNPVLKPSKEVRKPVKSQKAKHIQRSDSPNVRSSRADSIRQSVVAGSQNPEIVRNRKFKRRLAEFLFEHDPDRIETCLALMTRYKEKHGLKSLNKKLLKVYNAELDLTGLQGEEEDEELIALQKEFEDLGHTRTRKIKKFVRVDRHGKLVEMSEKDAAMLDLFFLKYDNRFLEGENMKKLHDWTGHNGMASLNRRLKRRYKEDLDEFMFKIQKLRYELVEFFSLVDRTMLESSKLEEVVRWAVVEGREALNAKLKKRYDVNLDASTKLLQRTSASFVEF